MPMIKRKISLYQEQPISQNRQFGYSMRGNEFTADGAKFFINDVYDAALFCGFILNREYAGLTFNKLQSHKLALKRKFHKLISKIRAKIYFLINLILKKLPCKIFGICRFETCLKVDLRRPS